MSNKHLRGAPHNISDDCWWYEEPAGICIVKQIRDADKHIRTDQINISWRSLRAALRRKDKEDA